jgi:uncharacterized protein with HEPN domain
MNPDLDFLNAIREAAMAVTQHVSGHDRISFEADRKTRSAVLYEIVVMGEGVKRLSPEFRANHPNVSWKQIAGMRDRVVHSFDEVDVGVVWNVTTLHAPSLVVTIDSIKALELNT